MRLVMRSSDRISSRHMGFASELDRVNLDVLFHVTSGHSWYFDWAPKLYISVLTERA